MANDLQSNGISNLFYLTSFNQVMQVLQSPCPAPNIQDLSRPNKYGTAFRNVFGRDFWCSLWFLNVMAVETAALEESAGDKEKAILGKGKGRLPHSRFQGKG